MDKIKYIITDLDGTILKSTFKGISKETVATIRLFQQKSDHKLTIASGRHITMTKEYLDQLDVKLPIITSNGALVMDIAKNKIIASNPIPKTYVKEILPQLKALGFDVIIYSSKTIYGESSSDRILSVKKYNAKNPKYKIDFEECDDILKHLDLSEDVIKLLVTIDQQAGDFEKIKSLIDKHPELIISSSREDLCDINHKDATKGNALKIWCKYMNVKPENVLVYGDNHNDLSIFREAGYCVAPENAVKELKAIANEVIGSVDDNAVAKHIDDHFIKKVKALKWK